MRGIRVYWKTDAEDGTARKKEGLKRGLWMQ